MLMSVINNTFIIKFVKKGGLVSVNDTIYALATPPGQSAIAIIRISGPNAHSVLKHFGVLNSIVEDKPIAEYHRLKTADGVIVAASAETNPSATRIGSFVYGCKTSSNTGAPNSGIKAYIDCHTNTNVSDAWKTGAYINFATRANDGSLNLAQRISSDGEISKPKQPGFYARRTTSGDGRAAGGITEWHISGTGSYNEGGHFKTSGADQGKFVAPISGRYYFSAQPGYKQTNSNFQFYFRINGTNINEPVRVIDGGDDLTSHSAFTGSCIIYMTAGQKLDIYIGDVHHVNTTYNFFCGYLIG